jgi:hypothetical protein
MSLSFVDLFDWEKRMMFNIMHFWHTKDIDDWYQETEERKTAN